MAKTVLVVDDDPDMVEVLRASLETAGYATLVANNGADALQQARAKLPDLILLDLVLPEMDGYAVCESLRRHPTTAKLPVVMLTGLPGAFPRLAGVESGATDFFNKPFTPQQVIERVQKILGAAPTAA